MSEAEGIQMGFVDGRVNPSRTMTSINDPLDGDPGWIAFSEDVVTFAMQCATHWDGLAHVSYGAGPDGAVLYNGYPASSVTEAGASKLGIHLVGALVSRGVLLDVPRSKDLEILEPGYAITPADLDAACARGGVESNPAMSSWSAPDRPPTSPCPGDRDSEVASRCGTWWPTPGRRRA